MRSDSHAEAALYVLPTQSSQRESAVWGRNPTTQASYKRWYFLDSTDVHRIARVSEGFGKALGMSELGIDTFISRSAVIDPGMLSAKSFFSVVQRPGDLVFGDKPHMVLGINLFQLAWNAAPASLIQSIVAKDFDIASIRRERLFKVGLRPHTTRRCALFSCLRTYLSRRHIRPHGRTRCR